MREESEVYTCDICGKIFPYNEKEDLNLDESATLNGRKMIIDNDNNMIPLYALPPDKRRLVNEKFIKLVCGRCISDHLRKATV